MSEKKTGEDNTDRGVEPVRQLLTSKKVSDHLANERTFLAWIRTGLATITFGFVVERFGLLLRQLGLQQVITPGNAIHYSAILGISLMVLGTLLMVVALINFIQVRSAIDREQFHPQISLSVLLVILTCLFGILLIIYVLSTT